MDRNIPKHFINIVSEMLVKDITIWENQLTFSENIVGVVDEFTKKFSIKENLFYFFY